MHLAGDGENDQRNDLADQKAAGDGRAQYRPGPVLVEELSEALRNIEPVA